MSNLDIHIVKKQVTEACLEIFPDAKAITFWGGIVGPDYCPKSSDIDVIIELDQAVQKEGSYTDKLKSLLQLRPDIDPFLFATENTLEPGVLEFIAPFGFYKANPFIPYYIKVQHQVVFGTSRLLDIIPEITLSEALAAYAPQINLSLRRLRLDSENESLVGPIFYKNQAAMFVMLRTLYAYHEGSLASKRQAIQYFRERFQQHSKVLDALTSYLDGAPHILTDDLSPEGLLLFSKDMAEALFAAQKSQG